MNEILLRRKNKVIIESGNNMKPCNQYIVTLMKNVESLGYTFSKELFERLQTLSEKELQTFYLELVPELKKLTLYIIQCIQIFQNQLWSQVILSYI